MENLLVGVAVNLFWVHMRTRIMKTTYIMTIKKYGIIKKLVKTSTDVTLYLEH